MLRRVLDEGVSLWNCHTEDVSLGAVMMPLMTDAVIYMAV